MVDRRRDRPVAGPRGRDDRHARADRAAAQLRRPRRRAGRLERLPRRSRPTARRRPRSPRPAAASTHAEVFIGVFIGAVTFTGSIVAFLKLSARIKSSAADAAGQEPAQPRRAGRLRRRSPCWFVDRPEPRRCSIAVTVLALALGWHLVASIGGGDMPVVVSMLNSYSGWAAAASGFLLGNDLLIITGALVGSSGAYLSYIMCKAMNRSFISVIAGGFGIEARRRPTTRTTASTARSPPRTPPSCSRERRLGDHHARLRHGGGPGPVPGRRAHPQAARHAASTSGSASTPSPAGCPGT